MARISWDNPGQKKFELGVDRGVLYSPRRPGVPWNGLRKVTEQLTGGEVRTGYMDGHKYYQRISGTEFTASLEAYTYPDEFMPLDGLLDASSGLFIDEQPRYEFDFSYRTFSGSDLTQGEYDYKIHLVYNALASPTTRENATITEDPELANFSWSITTRAVVLPGYRPAAHLVIDSGRADPDLLSSIENILYGGTGTYARMILPSELFEMFDVAPAILEVIPREQTGLAELEYLSAKDLRGELSEGVYTAPPLSRLVQLGQPGLYRLEP